MRERASDIRCEECGGFNVRERVYANVSVPAEWHKGSPLAGLADPNAGRMSNLQVMWHPIEGAEFFQCFACGWTLMATRKTLEAIRTLTEERQPVRRYKEGGNSMEPIISSMQPVDLYPVDPTKLEKGDIVLVRVQGKIYTHLVSALEPKRVQISNNHGKVNGWTPLDKVYGIVVRIGDNGPKTKALRKVPADVLERYPVGE